MVKRTDGGGHERHKRRRRKRLEDVSLSSYVAFSIAILIIYSIAEMITASVTDISHDTLTTCFFAAFGGEILAAALIKIYKLKEEDKEDK